MISDKRICQYLLVPYVIWQLADGGTDLRCQRIKTFIELFGAKLIPNQNKRFKLSKRVFNCTKDIMHFVADGDKFSGHKVVFILFHLTQLMFDSKNEVNLNDTHWFAIKKINFILDYVLTMESKDRYNRLDSDDDFLKLESSAKKQARKIFDTLYQNI